MPDNVTLSLPQNENITLLLSQNQREHAFKANISRIDGQIIGLQLLEMTTQKAIDFTACTFDRADTWADWQHDLPVDKPLNSLKNIIFISMQGYNTLLKRAPYFIYATFRLLGLFLLWLSSLLPQHVNVSKILHQS